MLFTPTTLPMNNSGIPWGTIILALIIIGGVGYITYNIMQSPKTMKNLDQEL